MQEATAYPISANEAERIVALQQTQLLDSAPEPEFDAIVEDAKQHFDVPIALISLVDRDRQLFKARCGLTARETGRDIAFCAHAIMKEHAMVVADATQDERFKNNPLVLDEPRIRFYAGAPIIVPDGLVLGTLCIIDTKPRHDFDASDALMLEKMADAVRDHVLARIIA